MTHHLVVLKPFLQYLRGDIITDANAVAGILATEHKKFVNKIAQALKG